jgi:hypothetical protein
MTRPTDTFHMEFETREFPGKVQYVEITINKRVTSDPNKKFRVDLCDHPLFPALVRYVDGNRNADNLKG